MGAEGCGRAACSDGAGSIPTTPACHGHPGLHSHPSGCSTVPRLPRWDNIAPALSKGSSGRC